MTQAATASPAGALLREWRQRRRLSQLALAVEAEVSTRHLSFVETGRAQPSRALLLHLAEQLQVPLRERNALLLAAGYAPIYAQRALDEAEMTPIRQALDRILQAHEPFPAVVVDRYWNLVSANGPAQRIMGEGAAPELLAPPANVLRLAMHPDGLAPRIENFAEYGMHLLARLHREVQVSGDPRLAALEAELQGYAADLDEAGMAGPAPLFVPLILRRGERRLRFFSTVATFGTALDVTIAELSIESFFPADAETQAALPRS